MTNQLAQPAFRVLTSHTFLHQVFIRGRPTVRLGVSFAGDSAILKRAANMGKFRIGSWFGTKSNGPAHMDAEHKKNNRRTSSYFASDSPLKVDLQSGAIEKTFCNKKGGGIDGKVDRPSVSTTKSVSDKASDKVSTPSSKSSDMINLSKKIAGETEKLERYMKANGLAMPGFGVDAADDFPKLPEEIQESRLGIIHATKELRDLAVGPRENLRWGVWEFLDVLALQVINNYGIAKLVPLDKPIALTELQSLTTLDPINLARILRTAMTNHIFSEPSPGVIAHTAASRLLATDDNLVAWVGFNSEDIFPSAAHTLEALKKFPDATSLTQSGFQFAFNTVDKEPIFSTFRKDETRARRMGLAMASLTNGEGYEPSFFVNGCDLSEVDARSGTFVDIGGSHGFVCVELARRWRGMRFVVQDLVSTVESAPNPVSEGGQVAERVKFMAHDFFMEQVVKGADVYYFRWIMHNYSTPYAVKILQNLVPALKPGARIIINDHCLREPGQENAWDEKIMRRMDMVMLTLLNAQERTEAEFRELFRLADECFVFKGVTRPNGCRMSIIEAVWEGVDNTSKSGG
ncbi:Sterigmatocystin 8-O-methyltransferase [Cytospora mali]|uniref:Sterigmatocystin 8-O-methyltransferase n=1 Tax=Cytospora mali TaxID=578113 RepID=A0A194VJ35_CYTMA|nr:Sterigmatocystin 8-O-methyltransferase [Valsa mali]